MNKTQLNITAQVESAESAKELLKELEVLHDKYEVFIDLQIDRSLLTSREPI